MFGQKIRNRIVNIEEFHTMMMIRENQIVEIVRCTVRDLGQNANDKMPVHKTPIQKMHALTQKTPPPNTRVRGISYIGVLPWHSDQIPQ